jgi:hypothetical protein
LKISHFIEADLFRLARNAGDRAQLFVTMQQLGLGLVSNDDPVTDAAAVGKLAGNMMRAMNLFHSDSCLRRPGIAWNAPCGVPMSYAFAAVIPHLEYRNALTLIQHP